MNRVARTLLAVTLCASLSFGTSACSQPGSTGATAAVAPAKVRIGTLPTEDSLPLWVAERDGLFTKAGLSVEIVPFQSAKELDAALAAGTIDGATGDVIAAASLRDGGVPVKIARLMLGSKRSEGRIGIAVKPGSKIASTKQLGNVPVGVARATIQEYVLDAILKFSAVTSTKRKKEEVVDLSTRYKRLMSGKLGAAVLPEPFLSLAAESGAKVIADDTTATASSLPTVCIECTKTVAGEWARGANLSQSVLLFSQKYLDDPAGASAVAKLLGVWDQAATVVNKDPDAARILLVDKAGLPKALETGYAVNTYPTAQLPAVDDVNAALKWMIGTGLLKTQVTYADLVWSAPAK